MCERRRRRRASAARLLTRRAEISWKHHADSSASPSSSLPLPPSLCFALLRDGCGMAVAVGCKHIGAGCRRDRGCLEGGGPARLGLSTHLALSKIEALVSVMQPPPSIADQAHQMLHFEGNFFLASKTRLDFCSGPTSCLRPLRLDATTKEHAAPKVSCFLRDRKSREIRGGNYAAKGLTRLAFEIEERSQETLRLLCAVSISCDPMCVNTNVSDRSGAPTWEVVAPGGFR